MQQQMNVAFKEVKSRYSFDGYYEIKYTVSGAPDGAAGDSIGLCEINPFSGHRCLCRYDLPAVKTQPGEEVDRKITVRFPKEMNFRYRHEFYYLNEANKCLAKSGYFEVVAPELEVVSDLEKRIKTARTVVSDLKQEISNYEEQLAELNLEIEEIQNELISCHVDGLGLDLVQDQASSSKLDKLNEEYQELKNRLSETEEYDNMTTKLKTLTEKNQQLNTESQTLAGTMSDLETSIERQQKLSEVLDLTTCSDEVELLNFLKNLTGTLNVRSTCHEMAGNF